MTANQIAYAGLKESERHNQADEAIREEQNRINEFVAETDRYYKENSLAIQSKYNELRIELDRAQGDKRNEIQQQLANIEQEKQALDTWYKAEMVGHDAIKVDIADRQQQETERYQKRLNELGYDANQIAQYTADIKNKEAEYKKYSIDLTNAQEWARINNTSEQLRLQEERQNWQRELELYQYKFDLERWKNDTKIKGINLIIDALSIPAGMVKGSVSHALR